MAVQSRQNRRLLPVAGRLAAVTDEFIENIQKPLRAGERVRFREYPSPQPYPLACSWADLRPEGRGGLMLSDTQDHREGFSDQKLNRPR